MIAPLPVACSPRPRGGAPTLLASVAGAATRCRACGLGFAGFNVGDGPAAFVTLGIRALIVVLRITFELVAHPPFRARLSLGLPLTTAAVMGVSGVAKGAPLAIDVPAVAREGRMGRRP